MRRVHFDTFKDIVGEAYGGNNNTAKKALAAELRDAKLTGTAFEKFIADVKAFALKSAEAGGRSFAWREGDLNLNESFSAGKGHADKAAACHFYFLCHDKFAKRAATLNRIVNLPKLLEGKGALVVFGFGSLPAGLQDEGNQSEPLRPHATFEPASIPKEATELSSPYRSGYGGLLTFTRGTAILDEQHAEQVLGHLVNIERHRDRVEGRLLLPGTMIEDDADGAIDALTAYAMRASNTTALAPILNALFEVAVWSDAEAYARRGAYAVLGADYLAKMDMTQPHAVRLGMELAHVFHVNGDQQNGKRILVLLPGLQELPDDPATAKALLRRADTVYELDKLGYDAVSDFLTQRFGSHCSLQGASMWRCAACAALKSKRYEDALAFVEGCKRQLASLSSHLLSMEDRLIPAYLGVIATIARVNMQPQLTPDEVAIKDLEAILAVVKEQARGYEPLLIGIRSEIIKLRRRQARHKVHDVEQNLTSISQIKVQIERTIDAQIKVMCFFDFNQIKQEIFAPDDQT